MSTTDADDRLLRETATALAQLHLEHYRKRTRSRRFMEGLTLRVAHPGLVYVLLAVFFAWAGAHVYQIVVPGSNSFADPPWFQVFSSYSALVMTALILAGQRRDEELSDEREELTIHLVALIDRKYSQSHGRPPIDIARAKHVLDAVHEEQFRQV